MTRFEFLKICHQCQKVTHYVIVIVIVRFIVVVLANVSITVTTSDCKIVRARSTIGSRPRPTHPPKIPSLGLVWFGLRWPCGRSSCSCTVDQGHRRVRAGIFKLPSLMGYQLSTDNLIPADDSHEILIPVQKRKHWPSTAHFGQIWPIRARMCLLFFYNCHNRWFCAKMWPSVTFQIGTQKHSVKFYTQF